MLRVRVSIFFIDGSICFTVLDQSLVDKKHDAILTCIIYAGNVHHMVICLNMSATFPVSFLSSANVDSVSLVLVLQCEVSLPEVTLSHSMLLLPYLYAVGLYLVNQ